MKLINISFLLSLLIIGLAACSNNNPEKVAKEFAQALHEGNFEKAKQFCTPETREGFKFLSKMAESDDFKKEKPSKVTVKIENCQISEDKSEATVTLSITTQKPSKEKETTQSKVNLLKYDGKWMVLFKAK